MERLDQIQEESIERIFFHVYNRGVEKRDIFMNSKDYQRFIGDLDNFNDTAPAKPHQERTSALVRSPTSDSADKNKLVHIHCFCLMPNHYHLLVSVIDKKYLTVFMRKLGTGYTNYFNKKYDRVGPLFQGKYKSVIVESNEHLMQLSKYIHLNPTKINNADTALIDEYNYSSYSSYKGENFFSDTLETKTILSLFGTSSNYELFVKNQELNPENNLESKMLID